MLRLLALLVAIAAIAFWYFFFDLQSDEPTDTQPVDVTSGTISTQPASEADATAVGPVGDLEAIECQLDVDRWDSGERAAVERKYGGNAEAVVEGCRGIVAPPAP